MTSCPIQNIQAWEEITQNYTEKINQLENRKFDLQCRVEALQRILEERSDSLARDKCNFPSFSPSGDRNFPSRSKKSKTNNDSKCPCKNCPYKAKSDRASCDCICRRMSTVEEVSSEPSSSSSICVCNNKARETPPSVVMRNDSSFCICNKEPTRVPEKCTCIVIPPPPENKCNEKLDKLLELIERTAPAVLGPENIKKDCNCNEVIDKVENAVKERIMPVVDGMLADFCDCVDNVRSLLQPKDDTESIYNPHSPNCICRQCLIENQITYSSTCDCAPCTCQPCVTDVKPSSCPCGEFCACQPCVFATKGDGGPCGCVDVQPAVSLQPAVSQQQETGHTPDCDCVDCICKPCILKEKASGKTTDNPSGNDRARPTIDACNCDPCPDPDINKNSNVVNGVCDCLECLCNPCNDPVKKNTAALNQPGNSSTLCDCLECLCNPCSNVDGKQRPASAPLPKTSAPVHSPECDCLQCVCDQCDNVNGQPRPASTPLPKSSAPLHGPECDCLQCVCDQCNNVNGQPQPASTPLPKTSAPLHSPECDCLQCVCEPCNDPKKRQSSTPGGEKFGDCDCKQCLCDPCKPPGNQKCDCDKCRCEACPFPIQVDCECLQCICQPCDKKPSNVNAPKQEPTVPTLGLVPPPVPRKPPVIFEQSHTLSSFDRFLQSAKAAAARCIPAALKPAPVQPEPVAAPTPVVVPDRPSRNLSIGNSACVCSPCSHDKPRPKTVPASFGGGRTVCDVLSNISLKSDDIKQMQEIIALFEKQKKLKRNIEALERRNRDFEEKCIKARKRV